MNDQTNLGRINEVLDDLFRWWWNADYVPQGLATFVVVFLVCALGGKRGEAFGLASIAVFIGLIAKWLMAPAAF